MNDISDGIKELLRKFTSSNDIDPSSQEDRKDCRYNRIARDYPAYISLLFPIMTAIYFLYDSLDFSLISSFGGIFNYLYVSALFIPALFILYKFLIRDISTFIVEGVFFNITGDPLNTSLYRFGFHYFRKGRRKGIYDKIRQRWDETTIRESDEVGFPSLLYSCKKIKVKEAIHKIREIDKLQDNHRLFEFHCIYGFYRNLVGGIAINIILIYICLHNELTVGGNGFSDFILHSRSILWWSLLIFSVLAWNARRKYAKKFYSLFMATS